MDSLNTSPIHGDGLTNLAKPEVFTGLSEENQKQIIVGLSQQEENNGGIMGKFFGNKKENAAMNIAFMVCILLIIIGIICMATGNEQWNLIITGIMTTVGYIFGRGSKD